MAKDLPTDPQALLVQKCIRNDRAAQKQMYEWLAPRMFAVCVRYVGDRDSAKDVMHDAFITLFSKLDTYKGEGSFEGWARKVFITASLMHLRKRDVLKYADDVQEHGNDVGYDPSVIERMDAQTLLRIVSQMPAGFRTVFNMYAIEGYSHQEIASQLGISDGGSRSQLSRARIWLKEKLRNY